MLSFIRRVVNILDKYGNGSFGGLLSFRKVSKLDKIFSLGIVYCWKDKQA